MTEFGKISTGKVGEDAACRHLEALGHKIVCRNWRSSHKEVDVVSLFGNELHFVEVKTKTAPVVSDPILNVNVRKQRNIISAAKSFMNSSSRKGLPYDLEVIFDILTVVLEGATQTINYYPNAYKAYYV